MGACSLSTSTTRTTRASSLTTVVRRQFRFVENGDPPRGGPRLAGASVGGAQPLRRLFICGTKQGPLTRLRTTFLSDPERPCSSRSPLTFPPLSAGSMTWLPV